MPPNLRSEEDASTLEELITAAFKELRPEVILDLTLETLAALPPDAYESLSRLLVVGLWDRLLLAQLPARRVAPVRRAEPPAAAPGCGQPIGYAISYPAISYDKLLG